MNKASKRDAVQIIRDALKEGWNRNIEVMRDCQSRPWNVQVSLTKCIHFPNGYINDSRQVILSFRKTSKGRWVISIAVPNGRKVFRGLWNAQYALRMMRECEQRQAERESVKAAS